MINVIGSNPIPPVESSPEKNQNPIPEPEGVLTPPQDNSLGSKPPKKKSRIPTNYILGSVILLLLLIGGGAGIYLMRVNQDLRQQADRGDYRTPEPTAKPTRPKPRPTTPPQTKTPTSTPEPTVTTTPTSTPEPTVTTTPTATPTDTPSEDDDNTTTIVNNNSNTVNNNVSVGETAEAETYSYSDTNQTGDQPDLPEELPLSGPEDWLDYLKIGVGALGVGAILLLFL